MSLYGQTWRINGVTAGLILRGSANGRYKVVIEREFAELPQIEAISWEKPAVEHLRSDRPEEIGLPEGYSFDVVRITYDSAPAAIPWNCRCSLNIWETSAATRLRWPSCRPRRIPWPSRQRRPRRRQPR